MLNPSFLTTMAINNGSPVSVLGIKAMGLESPECHEALERIRKMEGGNVTTHVPERM
jgi:hypothetical protein